MTLAHARFASKLMLGFSTYSLSFLGRLGPTLQDVLLRVAIFPQRPTLDNVAACILRM